MYLVSRQSHYATFRSSASTAPDRRVERTREERRHCLVALQIGTREPIYP